jgi:hypothetical protein
MRDSADESMRCGVDSIAETRVVRDPRANVKRIRAHAPKELHEARHFLRTRRSLADIPALRIADSHIDDSSKDEIDLAFDEN